MDQKGQVKIDKVRDKVAFNGIEEALSIEGIHISEPMDRKVHVLLDEVGYVTSFGEEEFLSLINSLKGIVLKPTQRIEISQLGVVLQVEVDSLRILVLMDWSIQSVFTSVQGERIRLDFGPLCEYNDCIYYTILGREGWIYVLKLRFVDGVIETNVKKVKPSVLKNELVFYTLGNKLGLL